MRVANPDTNTFQLQIAIRTLKPAKASDPTLLLVGVSHLGDTNYYQAVQKRLDTQGLVLFEGVRHPDAQDEDKQPDGARAEGSRKMEVDEDSIQFTLAKSLGLAFQLSAIDYERPNFRNSDMSIDQIARVLSGGRKPAPEGAPTGATPSAPGSAEFNILLQVMDGTSLIGRMATGIVRMMGATPRMQASTKLMLIELLGNVQGDISEMGSVPPDMKRLLYVLLHSRNSVVVADLKKELGKSDAPKSIAVFYGAAHMSDLEKRICEELSYRPAGDEWLPAITVKLGESGLTATDVGTVRGLVQWQLRLLQPQRGAPKPEGGTGQKETLQ